MLSQMGYQKGQGLGRNQTGRSEPVDILIKDKRTGLGMDEEQKRKREEAEKMQVLQGVHLSPFESRFPRYIIQNYKTYSNISRLLFFYSGQFVSRVQYLVFLPF